MIKHPVVIVFVAFIFIVSLASFDNIMSSAPVPTRYKKCYVGGQVADYGSETLYLAEIGNESVTLTKQYGLLFKSTSYITIPKETGTMFQLGNENYWLTEYSDTWIIIRWKSFFG